MTIYGDLEPCDYFGREAAQVLRAVGWIGRTGFPTGQTDASVYAQLSELFVDPFQPVALGGVHGCAVCQFRPESSGGRNLFVPGLHVIYVCPELIVHYMNAHHYAPPQDFCAAVLSCPDTRSIEYKKRLLDAGGRVLLNWPLANVKFREASRRYPEPETRVTNTIHQHQLHSVQPVHLVRDVATTVAYYRDVLAFEVDFVHGDPPIHARVVTGNLLDGNAVFIRFEQAKPTDSLANAGYCYVHVTHDLDGLCELYRRRGVHIEQEPTSHEWGLRDFYIRDCDGYLFCFAAEVPTA